MLSAGPISHNRIHLLIVATDFVAISWFTGYVVFLITCLTGAESEDQFLLYYLTKFCPVFLGSS